MTFYEVLTEAVNEFIQYGFDNQSRLDYWIKELRAAAIKSLISEDQLRHELDKSLKSAYTRLVTKGGLVSKDVSQFTVDRLTPKLRAELDRRIVASANLIKFNREESINNTLRRFSGWATSIPAGGNNDVDRRKEKKQIKKELGLLPFKERRVIIDQTHKLINNINEIVAVDNGAIAAQWHSNWRQSNYNYREDHKELDENIYLIRDSWAQKEGYIKPKNGYTNDVVAPGEEVFCRCRYYYLYRVSQLPDEMVTQKGKEALQSKKIYQGFNLCQQLVLHKNA